MFKKTETELILQLKKGSMKAFDEIYGLYARRLFAFCLKYTKSKENAEEIMEDTFVWLWNNRSTLEEAESVKPLLFLRAKHYLINAYRKVINSPVYEDYMDYLDHHNSTAADSQLEYDDFVRQLNQMLAKLPKTQQEIIRLSKLEMLNNQEIAERLNYSEQTVKNQLSMGLKQLRQLISNRTNLMWLLFLVQFNGTFSTEPCIT